MRRLAALAALAVTAQAQAEPPHVFIGGVSPGYATLADPAVAGPLRATGAIGLYQHANGNAALTPAQRAALWRAWGLPEGLSVGEIGGGLERTDPGYLGYFGGRYPAEVDMNIITGAGDGSGGYVAGPGEAHPGHAYGGRVTAADLAAMRAAIDGAEGAGARNVAVVLTPNGGAEDLDDPFATAPFWAGAREAALYGGGLALDVPPTYWALRGPAYQSTVAQMLRWAHGAGLRSSLIVSPYAAAPDAAGNTAGCGYDPAFMSNLALLAGTLAAADARPSEWVVENYGLPGPHCGTANDIAPGGADGLQAAALFLAHAGPGAGAR